MSLFFNLIHHLQTVFRHKYYVFYYCHKAGITWRGIVHDLSKFSYTELSESIRYYKDGSSPINRAKEDKGCSSAWMHHKGRNSHHYEFWVDRIDDGGYILRMPYEDILECLCDFLGANKAYNHGKSTVKDEVIFWNKKKVTCSMHPANRLFITTMLKILTLTGSDNLEAFRLTRYDGVKLSKIIYDICNMITSDLPLYIPIEKSLEYKEEENNSHLKFIDKSYCNNYLIDNASYEYNNLKEAYEHLSIKS